MKNQMKLASECLKHFKSRFMTKNWISFLFLISQTCSLILREIVRDLLTQNASSLTSTVIHEANLIMAGLGMGCPGAGAEVPSDGT